MRTYSIGSFSETNIANANLAIDDYIDAIAALAGSADTFILQASVHIKGTNEGSSFEYRMDIRTEGTDSDVLKTNLDSLMTEFEDMCTDSGLSNVVSEVHGYCRVTTDLAYPPGQDLEWSDDNPTTISCPGEETITIDGGRRDFTWSVEGTGFSLANAVTQTGSNTLIADESSCGTGIVTVIDRYGREVVDYVRSVIGEWSDWEETDRTDMDDVCPGCEALLANTFNVDPVCSDESNRYKWYVKVYESLTPPAICPDGQCPACDGYHGFCWGSVGDVLCTYNAAAEDLGSVYGLSRLILYRSEWIC